MPSGPGCGPFGSTIRRATSTSRPASARASGDSCGARPMATTRRAARRSPRTAEARLTPALEQLIVPDLAGHAGWYAHHDRARRDIMRHDRARSDERLLADLDARRQQHAAA